MTIKRLNHAVLYVRDARTSGAFYQDVLGFTTVAELPKGMGVFLRAPGSDNHHDLGLFSIGADAAAPAARQVGLYHLAWEVDTIEQLVDARDALARRGALVGASDHGASKSLYARDVDGIEFEVMWAVPADRWAETESDTQVMPLDLEREVARFGGKA